MEKLTMISPAPGSPPELGWPDESWAEYAEHSLTHDDLPVPSQVLLAAARGPLQADVENGITVVKDCDGVPLPRYPQRGERGWDWP